VSSSSDRARICVVGSANVDLVVQSSRLPRAGETLMGGPFSVLPGGKGANQAVAAARMGAAVSLIGCVGDDEHGRMMRTVLEREGVESSHLATCQDQPSGVALITVAEDGANTIIVAPGANATVSPADIDKARDAIRDADVLLMQLETPLPTVLHAATTARDLGTTVILNAAPSAKLPAELLAAVDMLIVNETEAESLASAALALRAPVQDAAESLLLRVSSLGVATSVLTLGAQGCLFRHGTDAVGRIAACQVEAIDTVGAGDAFCGTLAVRLAEHQVGGGIDRMAIMDAVCWACAAGGLATMKRGAIPSLPTRAEVVRLLRQTS